MLKEGADIFGFERPAAAKDQSPEYDGPIMPMKPEVLIETMLREKLNGQEAFSTYDDQIQWGRTPGAIRMVISPLGSFKSIVRKMQLDMEGKEVWVCKGIMPYKDITHANATFDETFAMDLFGKIEEINKQDIEAPSNEYKGLRNLTINLAQHCRRKDIMPEVFIFMGVKEMKKDENYLIEYECRGQGVEAPGSARIERFVIDMSYSPKTGMIKSFGHDIQSPTRGHVWYPQPSEWEEYFSTGQSQKEIINAIGAALSTY